MMEGAGKNAVTEAKVEIGGSTTIPITAEDGVGVLIGTGIGKELETEIGTCIAGNAYLYTKVVEAYSNTFQIPNPHRHIHLPSDRSAHSYRSSCASIGTRHSEASKVGGEGFLSRRYI